MSTPSPSSLSGATPRFQQHPWRFWLGLLLLMCVFGLLTAIVVAAPVLAIDITFERSIQAFHPPWMDAFTQAISALGFPPQSTLLDAAIVVALFAAGARWLAACAAFAAAGSAGLWFIIAPLVHRPRPTPDLVRVAADIPFGGFPSGHVLNLTAFFGFLAVGAYLSMRPGLLRSACIAVCLALVVLIGLARIYSGEHWPSDVLAGYVLGAAWLWITLGVYRWGAARWEQRSAHRPAMRP